MGITSIAVYSEGDKDSLHASLADESICIGPAAMSESYLHIPGIIAAAEICDAHAIHPGYGFLSENPKFAALCRECNIGFIGPSPEAISLSGDKAACLQKVASAGVPTIPGTDGLITNPDEALEIAKKIGFPVLVKASFGGGGKGMRIAHNEPALKNAITVASNEANAAFGDGGVYIEKFVDNSRHIEFQILADANSKNIIALGERECSIQRRHQKLIEESPSTALSSGLRKKMANAAVRAAKAIGYTNAGTAEFLLAPDNSFYFIEFNARIQVEHPVTEEVMNCDLVKDQIRIASGEAMQSVPIKPNGWSIEARINAEDPDNNFMPCPGHITRCHLPGGPGIRVDTHLFSGYTVPMYYDPLIAKVIAHGRDRDEASNRLVSALNEFTTEGIKNTASLCARIIKSDRFRRGDISGDMVDSFVKGG
jgi:acetyl-CoA carboxylase biotin carboxylase subunit